MAQLKCEIKIVRLANFDADLPAGGKLFVRYYIFAGKGRRVRIDTREVPSTSNPCWNELASLVCIGPSGAREELLEHHNVVFELRWRRTTAQVLGTITGSKLLGRAAVGWKDVFGSTGMSKERWISFVTSHEPNGLNPPLLLLEMKAQVFDAADKRRIGRTMNRKGCACRHSELVESEEDMLLAAATLNAW